jgi:hypothetical protein
MNINGNITGNIYNLNNYNNLNNNEIKKYEIQLKTEEFIKKEKERLENINKIKFTKLSFKALDECLNNLNTNVDKYILIEKKIKLKKIENLLTCNKDKRNNK